MSLLFKITSTSGIDYRGASYGVAWGDYNNDGFIDLWTGNHGFPATLYKNSGNGTFVDATLEVFGHQPQGDFHGAAWADFDNDGDLDLIQLEGADAGKSNLEDPQLANRLYVNENGVFNDEPSAPLRDRAIELGLGYIGSRGRNPLWFDRNNDGWLDLLQGAGKRADGAVPATIFSQEANEFVDLRSSMSFDLEPTRFGILSDLVDDNTPELITLDPYTGISIYDATTIEDLTDSILTVNYKASDFISEDFNGDLLPDLYLTRRGLSNSAFTSTSDTSVNLNLETEGETKGVAWKTEGEITIDLWTFGFSFEEIDPEDIFIGASALNPQDLDVVLGEENGTITELQLTLNPEDDRVAGLPFFTPAVDEGLYIGYDPASTRWEMHLSTPDKDLVAAIINSTSKITEIEAIAFNNNLQPNPDILLLNDGDSLIDRTAGSGINSVRTAGVATVAGDFDNDMDVDLYVVTTNAAGNEPNVLYDNQGDGTFKAVTNLGDAVGSNLGIGDTVSTADYDNDGFLDLFITNGDFPHLLNRNAPYQLLENEGNDNHWLKIDLEGVVSNRDGIGAKVYVSAGGITQLRQQSGGMHDGVQNDSRLHFGLADNSLVDEIRIEWSSGIVQNITNVDADEILNIVEPKVEEHSLDEPTIEDPAAEEPTIGEPIPAIVSVDLTEVHRFYQYEKGFHFYTADRNESRVIQQQTAVGNLSYDYEGESFAALASNLNTLTGEVIEGSQEVHRFFNNETGAHLFTMFEAEKEYIESTLDNYSYEGVAYYAYSSQQDSIDTIPVYRMLNNETRTHLFTVDTNEVNRIQESLSNFSLEGDNGVAFYVIEL